MKNISIITIFASLLIATSSCTNDKDPVPSANGFQLRSTAIVSNVVLSPAIDNDTIVDLEWDRSNNGFATASDYKVEIAKSGTNFSSFVTANLGNKIVVTPNSRKYSLKGGELNNLISQLPGYQCGQPMNIDIRIKSILGIENPNNFVQYSSNVISTVATPYSNDFPLLAFASSSTNLDSASILASSSISNLNDFEGYMYLEPGTYKFYKPNSCNEFSSSTVYGLSGTNTGSLVLDGSSGFTVATAGHYYVTANLNATGTNALTYKISAFNTSTTSAFGVFGKALRPIFGSANTTPMNYDPTTKKWSITVEMVNGLKFGFKTSSSAPVASLEGTGVGTLTESPLKTITSGAPTDGSIKAPGDFVDNNTKTKYAIEVDLSKPRNYTYKLTVVPN
jgi:starch-binding outer membrane protein SusE/F